MLWQVMLQLNFYNTNTVKTDYKQGFSGENLWIYIFNLQESNFLEEK